jgi:hypothetical protein
MTKKSKKSIIIKNYWKSEKIDKNGILLIITKIWKNKFIEIFQKTQTQKYFFPNPNPKPNTTQPKPNPNPTQTQNQNLKKMIKKRKFLTKIDKNYKTKKTQNI